MVKICGARLSMQNIQVVMIKGAKKAESWWGKWYDIEKVTWIPHKNAQKKEFLIWRGIKIKGIWNL